MKSPRHARSPQPLAGANVVVTRPASSATPLKRRIAALGGVALGLPGLAVRGTDDPAAARAALRAACAADLVVFTSPAAVKHAYALMPGLRFARMAQVCAVGAGSALALARRGVRNALWPRERQDSEGLLALAQLLRVRARRVVLIGAPGGRDLLRDTLRKRGARVELAHVYRRGAARLDRRHFKPLECASPPLLTLLSSAAAIAHLRMHVPAALFDRLLAGAAVVSSARLAAAARAAGWRDIHIARSANATDLCDAAIAALSLHRL